MYLPGKLESVFIEIICPNSSNLIIGCIYKHPMLHIGDFISNCITFFSIKLLNLHYANKQKTYNIKIFKKYKKITSDALNLMNYFKVIRLLK